MAALALVEAVLAVERAPIHNDAHGQGGGGLGGGGVILRRGGVAALALPGGRQRAVHPALRLRADERVAEAACGAAPQ